MRARVLLAGGVCLAIVFFLFYLFSFAPQSSVRGPVPVESEQQVPAGRETDDTHALRPGAPEQPHPGPAPLSDAVGIELPGLVDGTVSEPVPTVWRRPRFDGVPEGFSKEDFAKAEPILLRYERNFSHIGSLSLHHRRVVTAAEDTPTSAAMQSRAAADNWSVAVEATRSPAYFRMEGSISEGRDVSELITPAGKTSNGTLGVGESWVPAYLDGESLLQVAVLLKYGDGIDQGRRMDLKLPGLEAFTAGARATEYDVITMLVDAPPELEKGFWFSHETGMADFVVARQVNAKSGEPSIYDAMAIQYRNVGGIYYPEHTVRYYMGYQLRGEEWFTDLTVNGVRSSDE